MVPLRTLIQRHGLHPHFTDEKPDPGRLGVLPKVTGREKEPLLQQLPWNCHPRSRGFTPEIHVWPSGPCACSPCPLSHPVPSHPNPCSLPETLISQVMSQTASEKLALSLSPRASCISCRWGPWVPRGHAFPVPAHPGCPTCRSLTPHAPTRRGTEHCLSCEVSARVTCPFARPDLRDLGRGVSLPRASISPVKWG